MSGIDVAGALRVLCEAAGEDEVIELGGEAAETTLTELGFDSLVLMEATTRIEREFGATIPEDRLADVTTVSDFLDLVHEYVPAARPA